ncbi:DUF1646 family protein [Fervidibacillus halotolerans]|uniref:DUF1646 domain-containing protein n=1 Tax=Fervidibacillus halotolerans TaxID=2980027 RepID=A0A9E8M432_9BACI|nr:DUF1646 family protein [Fervidibacillus halotolerans]WAA14019.1 DUF1646 domain-containing protein [Fervidibacillus halotolerans]
MMTGLIILLLLVFFLPFTVKTVERNLEIFIFIMGVTATLISGTFSRPLLLQALKDPIKITIAVVIAGLFFKVFKDQIEAAIHMMLNKLSFSIFIAVTIVLLGLLSSIITAIIAALILVLIIDSLPLDRKEMVRFAVIGCFSIGLGAALTPIGEPLSTITISKLQGDFFLLFRLIALYVVPGIIFLSIYAAIIIKPAKIIKVRRNEDKERLEDILGRAIKIYFFVMGLTFLGTGFEPLIEAYLIHLSPYILYWINIISAVLDNATLAAAEISPSMEIESIKAVLLGLLVSGGMLLPGNIPNIISAGKLYITSREWARFGIPLGFGMLIIYFFTILVENVILG